MRGSTLEGAVGLSEIGVYPAHAGIDRVGVTIMNPLQCLPRACGDRPESVAWELARAASTPRMRGSTLREKGVLAHHDVYPAHAGIDPTR